MKLKKIASLALAGVMAISMLAGCATNNTNKDDNTETEVTTSVTALNAVKAAVENDANSKGKDITYKDLSDLANKLSTELAKAAPKTWKAELGNVLKSYFMVTGTANASAGTYVADVSSSSFNSAVTTDATADITSAKPQYYYNTYELDDKITSMSSFAWVAMTIGADLAQLPAQANSKDASYTVSTFEYTSKAADGTATNYLIVLVKAEAEA